MKINNQKIRNTLVFLLVAQSINLTIFMGLQISQAKLANYIYSQTAAPFLVQPETTYHKASPTIKVSQIEYSVLNRPVGKQTVAKR